MGAPPNSEGVWLQSLSKASKILVTTQSHIFSTSTSKSVGSARPNHRRQWLKPAQSCQRGITKKQITLLNTVSNQKAKRPCLAKVQDPSHTKFPNPSQTRLLKSVSNRISKSVSNTSQKHVRTCPNQVSPKLITAKSNRKSVSKAGPPTPTSFETDPRCDPSQTQLGSPRSVSNP